MRVISRMIRDRNEIGPLGLPWGVGIAWQAGLSIVTVGAVAQRAAHPLVATIPAALLAIAPGLYFICTGRIPPVAVLAPSLMTATAMLLWSHQVAFDIAPLILAFGLGPIAAQGSAKLSAVVAAAFAVLIVLASVEHRIEGVALYLSLLAMALPIGYMLALQGRLLMADRQAREQMLEHAADEERRRIAREIHDVIAHCISATLLHLTAARRELQQDGDTGEAINALVDAERLGRYAIADIRRTIGLLATEPTGTTPEPGIDDIAELVADIQSAGLALDYRFEGDPTLVSAATGLGVYRICQESLANVLKHAPTNKTEMTLDISRHAIVLMIRNDLPATADSSITDAYGGAGLRGMKQRAELLGGQLSAGPHQTGWSVHAHIPLSTYDPVPNAFPR